MKMIITGIESKVHFTLSKYRVLTKDDKCPIKGTSADLSRSYPLMAVKLGKEVATS